MVNLFLHHTNFSSFIKPSKDSFFRTITTDQVKGMLANSGLPLTLDFYDNETCEALRSHYGFKAKVASDSGEVSYGFAKHLRIVRVQISQ